MILLQTKNLFTQIFVDFFRQSGADVTSWCKVFFPLHVPRLRKANYLPIKSKNNARYAAQNLLIRPLCPSIPFCPLFHTFNFPFLWSVEIMLKSAPILSFTSQHTAYGAKSFEILLTFFQGRNYGYSKNVEPCCHLKVWFISAMLQYNVLKWKLAHKS